LLDGRAGVPSNDSSLSHNPERHRSRQREELRSAVALRPKFVWGRQEDPAFVFDDEEVIATNLILNRDSGTTGNRMILADVEDPASRKCDEVWRNVEQHQVGPD